MDSLQLLIADDHELVRRGMRAILEAHPGWNVAAEANDGRQAVEKAKEVKPEVSLLDISMPVLNGLDAAREIIRNDTRTKVLIVTFHESDPLVQEVLDAGAHGYVLKSDTGRDLVAAVDAVHRNKTYFSTKIAQIVEDGYLGRRGPEERQNGGPALRLTPRQREIVQLLAEGNSNEEVAGTVGISVKTAETHRANIMARLNCHSITELVCYAVRNHIIQA